jgi:hypothetical protein
MNAWFPGLLVDRELRLLVNQLTREDSNEEVGGDQTRWQPSAEQRGVFGLRLAYYLGLFVIANRINEDWQLKVFRGEALSNDERAAVMRGVFERWLSLNDHFRRRAFWLEQERCVTTDQLLLNLRLYTDEAHKLLREWVPPILSPSPAFHTQ